MNKSAMIRARIDPKLKDYTEKIFKELGLTTTQAINLFYSQVRLTRGLPFEVKIPNVITRKTFERTDKRIGVKSFKDKKSFFEDIGLR